MATPVHPYSDYGVALRTLRSARGWLSLLLAICLSLQMVGFLMMRFTTQPYMSMRAQLMEDRQPSRFSVLRRRLSHPELVPPVAPLATLSPAATQSAITPATLPATQPAIVSAAEELEDLTEFLPLTAESRRLNLRPQWSTTYFIFVPVTQLFGLLAAASQTIIIFITLLVILVAQAPGVAYVTRSLNSAVLMLFMVLPWQYFAEKFPIPGVLYGWNELLVAIAPQVVYDPAHPVFAYQKILLAARFLLWPLVVLVVLLITGERFRGGMRLAIGHPLQSMMAGGERRNGNEKRPVVTK